MCKLRHGEGAYPCGGRKRRQPRTLTQEGNIGGTDELKHGSEVDPYLCLCQSAQVIVLVRDNDRLKYKLMGFMVYF